jgi:hypothetical protein
MKRALWLATALLAFAAPAQASHGWTVQASSRAINVGGYRIYGGTVLPNYQGAIGVFGTPQMCVLRPFAPGQKPASNYSRVRWTTLGLTAEFITYGVISDGGDACSKPRDVQLSTLTVTGTRWRTDLGLKVGDTAAQLQHLYPTALPHNNAYWIITRKSVVGSVATVPVFSVTIAHGRVTSFVFSIGAQGE